MSVIRSVGLGRKRLMKRRKRVPTGSLIPTWLTRTRIIFCAGLSGYAIQLKNLDIYRVSEKSRGLILALVNFNCACENWLTGSKNWHTIVLRLMPLVLFVSKHRMVFWSSLYRWNLSEFINWLNVSERRLQIIIFIISCSIEFPSALYHGDQTEYLILMTAYFEKSNFLFDLPLTLEKSCRHFRFQTIWSTVFTSKVSSK